jgi:hypothetical protein
MFYLRKQKHDPKHISELEIRRSGDLGLWEFKIY